LRFSIGFEPQFHLQRQLALTKVNTFLVVLLNLQMHLLLKCYQSGAVMPSRFYSLYHPILNVGDPLATLWVADADDDMFEAPDDLNNDNQEAEIDGIPVTINLIRAALGPQVVVALVDGIEITLTLVPCYVIVENGIIDDLYLVFPGLPPGATIISADVPVISLADVPLPLCLAGETLVDTARGQTPAVEIRPGALVRTRDRGLQPVRWVGRRRTDFARHPALRRHTPILFQPGTIDGRAPHRALRLSPQHKVLICGWRSELFFGQDEVLVPAKALINGTTVRQETENPSITYVHLLFETHEVITAEGAPVESLFLGDVAMSEECCDIRDELLTIFPEIETLAAEMTTARTALRYREARLLAGV
jgi:hypothetical protein